MGEIKHIERFAEIEKIFGDYFNCHLAPIMRDTQNYLNRKQAEEMFRRVARVCTKSFHGMKAASASVILHCLKPYTFPVLNSNHGSEDIYSALGIPLESREKLETYIDNCRKIKAFRDANFSFKNYRIMDMAAWELTADPMQRVLSQYKESFDAWFPEDHPVQIQLGKRFRHTQQCTSVQNYMAFLRIREERPLLEKELTESIHREVEGLRDRYRTYLELLQDVRDEASWFPFPQALKEFSGEFNECAGIINWAFACNFNDAGTFQRAEAATPKVNDLLRSLRKRLKMLRVVRDVTLFCLTSIKTFAWMEILGLLLCFIAVPLIILLGDPNQIDHPLLDDRTNGLSYAAEKMKNRPYCWQVTMTSEECERSVLAKDAATRM